MLIQRPWDTIEKVDQAFSDYNREQAAKVAGKRLTVRAFRDLCMSGLKAIAPEERAAIDRWSASRMRG